MKKLSIFLIMLMTMAFGGVVCHASIIPPEGPGQIGFASVVLCDSLSLHQEPSFDSAAIKTLKYGDRIIVMSQTDEWANVVLGDSEDSPSGWVDVDYIAVDPAWYRCDEDTPVYAWDDTGSKKVAFLDKGTTLPILRDDGDWMIVSLRGATGWITNPGRSTTTMYGDGSGGDDASGRDEESGAVVVVYDENGESFTLYEGTDGIWRDREGTEYVQVSDTQFQVKEGTKRLSA